MRVQPPSTPPDVSINTRVFPPLVEIDRIQKGEPKKEDGEVYLDLFTTKNIKLKERVLIPVKQYPKVGFPLSISLTPNQPLTHSDSFCAAKFQLHKA